MLIGANYKNSHKLFPSLYSYSWIAPLTHGLAMGLVLANVTIQI